MSLRDAISMYPGGQRYLVTDDGTATPFAPLNDELARCGAGEAGM